VKIIDSCQINLKVIVVICSCLFSCGSEKFEVAPSEFYEVAITDFNYDTLQLKIDSLTVIPQNSQLIQGDSALFVFNKSISSLEFYNLHTSEFSRVRLEVEGPNGIGGTTGLYYISKDTIIGARVNQLIFLNSGGKVFKRLEISLDDLGMYPDIMVQGTKPVIKRGDSLIFGLFPHLNPHNGGHLSNWKSFVEIDLKSGVASSFGDLPKEMIDNVYGINFMNFSFVMNQNEELVISFTPLKDLFKIDLNSKERNLERIPLKSPNFSNAEKLPDEDNNEMRYVMRHYLFQPSFDALFFDGESYLRVLQEPISEVEFESMSWAKKKTLIIYNDQFEAIYSRELNSKSLSYNMIFPYKKGYLGRITSKSEEHFQFLSIQKNE